MAQDPYNINTVESASDRMARESMQRRQAADRTVSRARYAAPSAAPAPPPPTVAQRVGSAAGTIKRMATAPLRAPGAVLNADVGAITKGTARRALGVARGGLGKLGFAGAGIVGAHEGYNTDTSDYATRFGVDMSKPAGGGELGEVGRDLTLRAAGVLSDVANTASFGYLGKHFADKRPREATAAAAAASATTNNGVADTPRPADSQAPAGWQNQAGAWNNEATLTNADGVVRRATFTNHEQAAGRAYDQARANQPAPEGGMPRRDMGGGGSGAVGAVIANPYAINEADKRRSQLGSDLRKYGRGSPSMRRALMENYRSEQGDEASMAQAGLRANTDIATNRETNAARLAEGNADRSSREGIEATKLAAERRSKLEEANAPVSAKDRLEMELKYGKGLRDEDEANLKRPSLIDEQLAKRGEALKAQGVVPGRIDEMLSAEAGRVFGRDDADRSLTGAAGKGNVERDVTATVNAPLPLINWRGFGDDDVPNTELTAGRLDMDEIQDLNGVNFEDTGIVRRYLTGAQKKMSFKNKEGKTEGRFLYGDADEFEARVRAQRR